MQLTQIFTIILAAAVASGTPMEESRDLTKRCYSTGKTWGENRDTAISRAGRWCSGNGGSGTYGPGQIKGGCYNLKHGTNKVVFEIQNKASTPRTLSSHQCNIYMQDLINGCTRGGRRESNNYSYRADVNEGRC